MTAKKGLAKTPNKALGVTPSMTPAKTLGKPLEAATTLLNLCFLSRTAGEPPSHALRGHVAPRVLA